MFRARKFKDLEAQLGYKFKKETLVERALTHASYRGQGKSREDNERLEFLGDRVLGLAIAELLNDTYPAAKEGELARRLNKLVSGETCAKAARQIDLGKYLILSESEAGSGGRDKETILADAMEAILGAVFADGGYDKGRAVVRKLWTHLDDQRPKATADAKSALQEWAQGQGLPLPRYTHVARSGPDHAPVFVSEVQVSGRGPARGEGASKRAAEQAAASALLTREGVHETAGAHIGIDPRSEGKANGR